MKRLSGFFKNLLLVVISTFITLFLLEGAARLLFRKQYTNALDFRLSRPVPYKDSDYFSEDFIRESFKQPGEWINPPGTRVILPANYEGKYFHVREHLRVTTGQPAGSTHDLHLFGGSTMYCSEVPDNYTIASFLQSMVGNGVKVINYGVTSINTFQQKERLKTVQLDSGDVVIFYGGVNDGLLFTTGRVDGWIMGENYIEYERTQVNWFQKARFHLYQRLHKHSSFVENFLDPFSYETPKHLQDTSKIESLKEQLKTSYIKSIKESDSICRSKKAIFINFIQPHILCRQPNSGYEQGLLRNKYLIPAPFITALQLSYPALRDANKKISNNILTYDISESLSKTREEFFLDYCHITEKGNKLVAGAIYDKIRSQIKK